MLTLAVPNFKNAVPRRAQSPVPSQGNFGRSGRLRPSLDLKTPTLQHRRRAGFMLEAFKDGSGSRQGAFFKRVLEEEHFKFRAEDDPNVATVLVGPPYSGKTRRLKHLLDQRKSDNGSPPCIYLDGRRNQLTGPEELSETLCNLVLSKPFQKGISAAAATFLDNVPMTETEAEFLQEWRCIKAGFMDDKKDLTKTLKKMRVIFNAFERLPKKPMFILDEADKLMGWKDKRNSISELLTFLNKHAELVDVVIATKNYRILDWFSGGRHSNFQRKAIYLGDMSENEALAFVYGDAEGTWPGIINDSQVPDGAEAQWPAIYERCGGNIGLLKACVDAARTKGDWKGALDTLVGDSLSLIRHAFNPDAMEKCDVPPLSTEERPGIVNPYDIKLVQNGTNASLSLFQNAFERKVKVTRDVPLWTARQWKVVLESITKAPHHAVLRHKLLDDLEAVKEPGGASAKSILLSMVEFNLLTIRPDSSAAQYLPVEVQGELWQYAATFLLPSYLWAAKETLKDVDFVQQFATPKKEA